MNRNKLSDRPREAGWGLPRSRFRLTASPRQHARASTAPSGQRALPSRLEPWGRAIQSPKATAQSAHREAASSSEVASARPTGPELRPHSPTALRIQLSSAGAPAPWGELGFATPLAGHGWQPGAPSRRHKRCGQPRRARARLLQVRDSARSDRFVSMGRLSLTRPGPGFDGQRVPDAGRVVARRRSKPSTVRTEGDGVHKGPMAAQFGDLRTRGDVPESNRVVGAAGGRARAVRGERQL